MRRFLLTFWFILTLLIAATSIVWAQGPPPGGFPPPGGGDLSSLPPAIRKKIEAWQTWNKTHKNITALDQMLNGFAALDAEPRTRLTAPQAKKILPVLKTWRTRTSMTDTQARQVNQQLTASLNVAQLKALTRASQTTRGAGGPNGPGGGGPPAGMRPPGNGKQPSGGGRPEMPEIPDPKDYNPLNPDTLPFTFARPMAKQRLNALLRTLTTRSKGK